MKYVQAMGVGLLVLLFSLTAQAVGMERFVEGVHYTRLDRAQAMPNTVVEFFSYGCPHCAHFEPVLEQWVKQKPASVKLVRIPAAWNPRFEFLARVYYALEAVGLTDKLSQPLFDHLHKQQKPLETLEQATAFVVAQGGDGSRFEAAFKAPDVDSLLAKGQQIYGRYQVSGVPALLVNGQYMTSSRLAGSDADVFEVVNFLLAK